MSLLKKFLSRNLQPKKLSYEELKAENEKLVLEIDKFKKMIDDIDQNYEAFLQANRATPSELETQKEKIAQQVAQTSEVEDLASKLKI